MNDNLKSSLKCTIQVIKTLILKVKFKWQISKYKKLVGNAATQEIDIFNGLISVYFWNFRNTFQDCYFYYNYFYILLSTFFNSLSKRPRKSLIFTILKGKNILYRALKESKKKKLSDKKDRKNKSGKSCTEKKLPAKSNKKLINIEL